MFRRHAHVRQRDQSDCGAAALASIALWHRRPVALRQVRQWAGVDREGSSLRGLVDAARRIGFQARAVRGPYEALAEVPLPAIALLERDSGPGHYVVVHRAAAGRVLVGDPAAGVAWVGRQQFEREWTGKLVVLVPDMNPPSESARPVSALGRLTRLLAWNSPTLLEAGVCGLLMTLLGLASPFFVQQLVDSALLSGEAGLLNALGIGMALVIAFRVLFALVRRYLLAFLGRRVDLLLLSQYAGHLLRLPMAFYETRRVGEMISRVHDANKIRRAVSAATLGAITDGVFFVVSLAVLWSYDARLAAVATLFMPAWVLLIATHHPAGRRRSRAAMEDACELTARLVEDVSGIETVKAFGVEERRGEEHEQRIVRLAQSLFSLETLGMRVSSAGLLLSELAGLLILWYGGYRVLDGALSIGQLMFFYTMLVSMLAPLERLASLVMEFQEALVAMDRLGDVLDCEPEPAHDQRLATFTGPRRQIEFRDVDFRYGRRGAVLEGMNLRIPAGQTVAIVGESGSGKSTLLKLLLRYHEPQAGQILIDGVDVRDYSLGSYRSRIAVVSQEPFIFNGTLRDNIALGRPEASLDEVLAAARAAGLDEVVAGLPQRYETEIGERGANLSGGQRQRLAIARALLMDPDILVFDEATSHLDTQTEQALQRRLKQAFAGRTVLLVAHRLSTVQDADTIYVLDKGRVVQHGTPAELRAQPGKFRSFWEAQEYPSYQPGNEPCKLYVQPASAPSLS
ncbi:MAG: peptidase domain-containing ABC transporter [Pirellulaceae bacterium]|nr:peptidase domain-containing ABC transporter [Pirellulaceae bacterium]